VHGPDALERLLPGCGAVIIAVPLGLDTRGLVDGEFLARLPDGAVLVKVSRGPVVDQTALAAELWSGRLRAALDVATPDPLAPDDPLRGCPTSSTPRTSRARRRSRCHARSASSASSCAAGRARSRSSTSSPARSGDRSVPSDRRSDMLEPTP
jgi:phosphoglycerate dehydrogenase-like enzyme